LSEGGRPGRPMSEAMSECSEKNKRSKGGMMRCSIVKTASVLNSCRVGPCRVRARRAFMPYRAVSFIILFFFVSCRVVSKNDRRRHDTDKARRVWRAVP
jgi:hypothetical protein